MKKTRLSSNGTSDEPDIETITYKRKESKGKRDKDISLLEVVVDETIELSEAELDIRFPKKLKAVVENLIIIKTTAWFNKSIKN